VWSHKGPTLKGIKNWAPPGTQLFFPGLRSDTFWIGWYATSKLRRDCYDNKFKYLKKIKTIKEMTYHLTCILKWYIFEGNRITNNNYKYGILYLYVFIIYLKAILLSYWSCSC
jgi:hypothetical protein